MKLLRIRNSTRGQILCERCGLADGLWTRARGLMGRSALPLGEGLLLAPCSSIHMFHMKFALDVIFVTSGFVVTDLVEGITPGKTYISKAHHGKAHSALEVPAGVILQSGTQLGDVLEREEIVESAES